MTRICPKCQHARRPEEHAPAWQCPACGVAYSKAADAKSEFHRVPVARQATVSRSSAGLPWGKLFLILAIVVGVWTGHQASRDKHRTGTTGSSLFTKDVSAAEIAALAATVQPADVVMYSTTKCPHCAQAKGWLSQNGFAFTECNMSIERRCESEFKSHGAVGTPYLLVQRHGKTHHMKDGFDSDEFLAALNQ